MGQLMRVAWLLLAAALLPMALAEVRLASDFEGDGQFSTYSEGIDHKLSASAAGQSEYSLLADLSDSSNSTVWQGLNASTGASFVARTPEYNLRVRNASDFSGMASLQRESTIEETREIITEVTNGSLVQIPQTVFTDAAIETSVQGNGKFSEDIDISYPGKARALKLRELDGSGNFSLKTELTLSGQQIKRGFGMLNETEAFDRRVILATDPETGIGPMGGI